MFQRRLQNRVTLSAAVAMLIGLGACQDAPTPTQALAARRDALALALASSGDYYTYFGRKIFLVEDPRSLVVESSQSGASVGASVAQQLGIPIDSTRPLPSMPTHTRVFLQRPVAGRVADHMPALRAQMPGARFVSPVYRTEDGHLYVPLDRLIVQFRPDILESDVTQLADSLGLAIERRPQPDSARTVYFLTSAPGYQMSVLAMAQTLSSNKRVVWAEPDRVSDEHVTFTPNDSYFGNQFYLQNSYVYPSTGVTVDVAAPAAWDLTTGSSSIVVAVLDEGVQASHPDLANQVIAGYDAFSGYPGEDGTHPCLTCVTGGVTGDAHGTAVAGIIAALQNNAAGISGVAPGVRLVSARVLRQNSGASGSQIAAAITWAWYTQQADVLNLSWGGGAPDNAITQAIGNATTSGRSGKGAIVVASAGNNTADSLLYPASLSNSYNMIAVGAITDHGDRASYSDWGTGLTVVAPSNGGTLGVTTTDLTGAPGYNNGPDVSGDYTSAFGGTSAAAPQVSGVVALLLSREPTLRANDVLTRVREGADAWGDSFHFGAGKTNAYRTLLSALVGINGQRTPKLAAMYGYSALVTGGVGPFTYDWERDDGNGSYRVSTGTSYSTYIGSGDPRFTLTLNVTGSGFTSSSGPTTITPLIP